MSVVPQVVTRNWRLKLAAFGLAVFLWAVVTVQPQNRQTLTSVPVQVVVADSGWVLSESPEPATVDVRLTGPSRDLLELPTNPEAAAVRVPIDLVTSSDTVVRFRSDWLTLDLGSSIVVENILPATVRLRFERTQATVLPLSVRTRGEFPGDLALAHPLGLNPPVVRVRGPSRMVEDLDSIPLEALDLARVTESGLHPVRVDTTGLGNLVVDPLTATIALRLEPAVERSIGGVPVVAQPPPGVDSAALAFEPSTIQVTLRGAATLVNRPPLEGLAAVVPTETLRGLAPGEARRVPIRLRGVPDLVRAFSGTDTVVARVAPPDAAAPDTVTVRAPGARPPT